MCLRLLGLMACTVAVIPLRLLRMRFAPQGQAQPQSDYHRGVCEGFASLESLQETVLGPVTLRKAVTTDVSFTGWGVVFEGKMVLGVWSPSQRQNHINYLELLMVFLALNHFIQFLQGFHVLIRSDNTTVEAYINRQGGLCSRQLHSLAHRLIVWSSAQFLSLRATHVPAIMNRGWICCPEGIPFTESGRFTHRW